MCTPNAFRTWCKAVMAPAVTAEATASLSSSNGATDKSVRTVSPLPGVVSPVRSSPPPQCVPDSVHGGGLPSPFSLSSLSLSATLQRNGNAMASYVPITNGNGKTTLGHDESLVPKLLKAGLCAKTITALAKSSSNSLLSSSDGSACSDVLDVEPLEDSSKLLSSDMLVTRGTLDVHETSADSALMADQSSLLSDGHENQMSTSMESESSEQLKDVFENYKLSTGEQITASDSKQRQLELQCQNMLKRLNRLRSRQVISHVRSQLADFVPVAANPTANELASLSVSFTVPSGGTGVSKGAVNTRRKSSVSFSDVPSTSIGASVLDSAGKSRSLIGPEMSVLSTGSSGSQQRTSALKLAAERMSLRSHDQSVARNVYTEASQVAGHMQSNLHRLQQSLDSDATDSSSGGESSDELEPASAPSSASLHRTEGITSSLRYGLV
jgi:hypothetical protein